MILMTCIKNWKFEKYYSPLQKGSYRYHYDAFYLHIDWHSRNQNQAISKSAWLSRWRDGGIVVLGYFYCKNLYTVGSRIIGPPEFLPLDPMVNKSCNIECCGNEMHQIIATMMLSQYFELKLSLLWRATVSFMGPNN